MIQISKGNFSKDTFYISNAGNYGTNKTAVLSGSNFLFYAGDDNGYISAGSGSFDGDKIKYSFKTFVPGPNPNVYGRGARN